MITSIEHRLGTEAILSIASLAYFVFLDVFRFLSVLAIVKRFFFSPKGWFSVFWCQLRFAVFPFFFFLASGCWIWCPMWFWFFLNLVPSFFVHSIKVNMSKLEYARSFGTTWLTLGFILEDVSINNEYE